MPGQDEQSRKKQSQYGPGYGKYYFEYVNVKQGVQPPTCPETAQYAGGHNDENNDGEFNQEFHPTGVGPLQPG